MPMPDSIDESSLCVSARDGDVHAIGELYRTHADSLYTAALRITGSAADAEDVLQDVFVGLPRALRSYRETGRFGAWLKRVAVRTALTRLRASRRKREVALHDEPAGHMAAASVHPVDRIALERAVHRLPEALRVVFVLREIEGYNHEEIAGLLAITPAASMTRLSRAWTALRQEFAR